MERYHLGVSKMIDVNKEFLYLWIVWIHRKNGIFKIDKIYESERWAKTRKTNLEKYYYRNIDSVHIQQVRSLIEVPREWYN